MKLTMYFHKGYFKHMKMTLYGIKVKYLPNLEISECNIIANEIENHNKFEKILDYSFSKKVG